MVRESSMGPGTVLGAGGFNMVRESFRGPGTVSGAGGFIFLVEPSSIVSSTQRPAARFPAASQVWRSHPNRKRGQEP